MSKGCSCRLFGSDHWSTSYVCMQTDVNDQWIRFQIKRRQAFSRANSLFLELIDEPKKKMKGNVGSSSSRKEWISGKWWGGKCPWKVSSVHPSIDKCHLMMGQRPHLSTDERDETFLQRTITYRQRSRTLEIIDSGGLNYSFLLSRTSWTWFLSPCPGSKNTLLHTYFLSLNLFL